MKLKVILPAFTNPRIPVPPIGLGTLMASLDILDEIVVTAEQAEQPAMWEDADLVVISVGSSKTRACNLAELYRMAGSHVVMVGLDLDALADDTVPRADTIFLGPPEEIWPAFLRDFREGEAGQCYASDFRLRAGLLADPLHAA